MKHRLITATALVATALNAPGLAAHTGGHAHTHPAHGPLEQVGHWLAGVWQWLGPWPLVLVAAAGAAALAMHVRSRPRRR